MLLKNKSVPLYFPVGMLFLKAENCNALQGVLAVNVTIKDLTPIPCLRQSSINRPQYFPLQVACTEDHEIIGRCSYYPIPAGEPHITDI